MIAAITVSLLALTGCDTAVGPANASPSTKATRPVGGATSPGRGGAGTPSGSGSPAGSTPPSSKPPTKPLTSLAALLAKIPHFPAAPTPVPVHLAGGSKAPIFFRLPVTAKVAFLTMDDGVTQLPQDLDLMRAAHIPFTMFLIGPVAKRNPGFFRQLVSAGGLIEDHTLSHPILRGRSYASQKNEICGARTMLTKSFTRQPVLFRPPYGDYDSTTLTVVHDCGMKAALDWSETARNGKVFYQTVHKVKPGDIILMHFRSTFAADLLAALTAIHKAGLTPALLEDYIG